MPERGPGARFAALVQGPDHEIALDEGALLIAAHVHPSVDIPTRLADLDELAGSVDDASATAVARALFVPDLRPASDRLTVPFTGNTVDYYDPANSYLDDVLDRRLGIPITLSVLMIEVGRRAGVALHGVGMPGHFLVGAGPDEFYDPFHGGARLDAAVCAHLFARVHGAAEGFHDDYLLPVGARAVLDRMLANLQQTFLVRATGCRGVADPAAPRVPGALPRAPERARGAARPAGPVLGGRRGVRRARRRAHGQRVRRGRSRRRAARAPAPIDALSSCPQRGSRQTDGVLRTRREMLALMGGVGAAVVIGGCGDGGSSSATGTTRATGVSAGPATTTTGAPAPTTTTAAATTASAVDRIPQETGGPYPADGSNGPNVLAAERHRARRHPVELRSSATASPTGSRSRSTLTLVDVDTGGVPLDGAAVYLWHCDIDGGYSMYSQGVTDENYLRGVQAADATARSRSPASSPPRTRVAGRTSTSRSTRPSPAATGGGNQARDVTARAARGRVRRRCTPPTATSASVRNLARTSLDTDNVFSDGHDLQLASVTGSPSSGYTASLTVGV